MSNEGKIYEIQKLINVKRAKKGSYIDMIRLLDKKYIFSDFHKGLIQKLEDFAQGRIKKNMMVFAPPQHGKLLPASTPVLTTQGFKNHGDLKKGDFVFNQKGEPCKVLANSGCYEWEVCEMFFQDGKKIKCAKEHLWSISYEKDDHKGRRMGIFETQDIFKIKHRRSPFIEVSPSLDIPKKDLPIDPYILGIWLGDGHKNSSTITVGEKDIEHFERYGIKKEVRKGIFSVRVPKLITELKKIGLYKNKHIPIDYILSSIEQRMELLRGLMDTDGYCDVHGNCEFAQNDNQLAKDVYLLLRSLGFKARAKKYDSYLNGRNVGKKIRIGFNPDKSDYIFKLDRKQKRLTNKVKKDRNDKYRLFIKEIKYSGERIIGNCIQVDGGMYLAGYDLIPTHNSQLTSRFLPAYLLGMNPDLKIASVSYSIDLARSFNRDVQRIIDSNEYAEIFPDTKINSKNVVTDQSYLRNSDEFEVVNKKGYYKAVGVTGGLSGRTVDIAIMDDLVKDQIEASSETYRERVWDWYLSVLLARLHNDSKILLIMTRWHDDDIAGRILKLEPEKWEVVKYKAINDEGQSLFPERHDLEKLNRLRSLSPDTFEAMYQQNPILSGGNKIKSKWFNYVDSVPGNVILEMWVDSAYTQSTSNDPTGIMICGYDPIKNKLYITFSESVFLELPELITHLQGFNVSKIYIEPMASGKSIKQIGSTVLRTPIIEIKSKLVSQGKEARAQYGANYIEAGNVIFVRGAWNGDFEHQLTGYRKVKHDEYIDLVGYACEHYFKGKNNLISIFAGNNLK